MFWKSWRTKSAIEQHIQTHLPMLERIVATYETRHALQQELLQEVVLAIWQAADRYQQDASIKTYMARIAQNRCITHVDKSVRNPDGNDVEAGMVVSESVGVTFEKERQWQQLMKNVRQLPLQQKQALSLMLEGFSYKEIGDICGLSESNVGVLINRGKATLKDKIGET